MNAIGIDNNLATMPSEERFEEFRNRKNDEMYVECK